MPPLKVEGVDRIKFLRPSGLDNVVYTPKKVVDEMLELLPTELWSDPNAKFLDPFCKTAIFLDRIYWKLFKGLKDVISCRLERANHILTNQLYGLSPNSEISKNCRFVLYGINYANHERSFASSFTDYEGNLKVFKRRVENVWYDFQEIINEKTGQLFKDTIREAFGDMKFDVVIGNPPYNKGLDLDFANRGFDLCTKYCVMVTPAKWQTAADDQKTVSKTINYGGFREKIVPHMSKVVFYPDCKDVFDVFQTDGISYYLIDKNNKYELCDVVNISKTRGNIYNSSIKRSILNCESLLNIGNEIINSMEPYKRFKFPSLGSNKRFNVITNMQISGYDWYVGGEPRYVLSTSRILDKHAGEKYSGSAKVVLETDDRSECESFISWLNTKFTRFFIVPNISKLGPVLTDYYFRFVPAPPSGKFDHIYTDEELYKAFNLPQKYIDVIEALIKERK